MGIEVGLGRFGDRRLEKGGRLACGFGGAALLVYSTAGGATVAGSAVYALPA